MEWQVDVLELAVALGLLNPDVLKRDKEEEDES